MGSILKLVYDNFIDNRIPLPNGLDHNTVENLKNIVKLDNCSYKDAVEKYKKQIEVGNPFIFDHSNLALYFTKQYGDNNNVLPSAAISSNVAYYYPIEIRTVVESIWINHTYKFNGKEFNYLWLNTISQKTLNLVRSGTVKLLFNYVHDPINEQTLENLQNYLETVDITFDKIAFVAGHNLIRKNKENSKKNTIKIFDDKLLISKQVADFALEYPLVTSLGYESDIVKEKDLNFDIIRKYRFLCLNKTLRLHRLALIASANYNKILENNLFTFLNLPYISSKEDLIEGLLNNFNLNDIHKQVDFIIKNAPYEIDTKKAQDKSHFANNNNLKELYLNSYINIVTETTFSDNLDCFITEKIWRPIMNLQPFIYFSNPNSLKFLKELGIKTFHPFIDESYDNIENPKERFNYLMSIIINLQQKPLEEIHNWYYSIADKLLYNMEIFLKLSSYKPLEKVFLELERFYNE